MNHSFQKTCCFFLALLPIILNGCASMAGNPGLLRLGMSWKEEVLLHDGNKIVVKRSQNYGGRHELGQSAPIREQTVRFDLPDSGKTVTWTSEYSEDIGRANFNLLAVHILNDTPYIVAEPNLCLSYNKWGRPNPPYVLFRYDGTQWNRIPLSELPDVFKGINVVNNTKSHAGKMMAVEIVTSEMIQRFNSSLRQPEYQTILREPKKPEDLCPEEIQTQSGGWRGIDWFSDQPNYEACMKVCNRERVSPEHCPCDRFFNQNSKEK